MAKTILVMFPLQAGKRLIELLDKTDFDVQVAFWYYHEERDVWYLTLASPLVDKLGPTEPYLRLRTMIDTMEQDPDESLVPLSLDNIEVRGMKYPLIKDVQKQIKTDIDQRIQPFRAYAGGIYLDSYVYRSR